MVLWFPENLSANHTFSQEWNNINMYASYFRNRPLSTIQGNYLAWVIEFQNGYMIPLSRIQVCNPTLPSHLITHELLLLHLILHLSWQLVDFIQYILYTIQLNQFIMNPSQTLVLHLAQLSQSILWWTQLLLHTWIVVSGHPITRFVWLHLTDC